MTNPQKREPNPMKNHGSLVLHESNKVALKLSIEITTTGMANPQIPNPTVFHPNPKV